MARAVIAVCRVKMTLNIWIRTTLYIQTYTKGGLFCHPTVLAGILSVMKECSNAIKDIDALLDISMLYEIKNGIDKPLRVLIQNMIHRIVANIIGLNALLIVESVIND
jgi:hypothetical protein